MRGIKLVFVFGLLFLTGIVSAGCATDAYSKSCSSCSFDQHGKMDSSCYGGYQSSAITCLSTKYPIASAKYSAGQCPGIDYCLSELNSCKAQYSSGNDKADCEEGSVAICFAAADECVKSAAIKCGEIEQECPGSSTGMMLLLVLVGIAKYKGI